MHFVQVWFILTILGLCIVSEHALCLFGHRRSEAALRAATALRRLSCCKGAKEKPSHTLTPSVNLYPIILKMLYLYKDHIQKIIWRLNILKTQGSFKNYLPLVLVFLPSKHRFCSLMTWTDTDLLFLLVGFFWLNAFTCIWLDAEICKINMQESCN